MKRTFLLFTALIALAACGGNAQQEAASEAQPEPMAAMSAPSALNISIKGSIDHTNYKGGVESEITFSHFPKSVKEFEEALQQLGSEPQGAVVLQLMAMELYRNNQPEGEKCLEMINTPTNKPSVISRLKELFVRKDPGYNRPYLVATFMQGSSPMNGYNPTKPYKVRVRTHPVNPYQKSQMLKGWVLELQVQSSGYDTQWRGCSVVKTKGDTHYRVSNCPSMYIQCKEISWETDDEFKGLD